MHSHRLLRACVALALTSLAACSSSDPIAASPDASANVESDGASHDDAQSSNDAQSSSDSTAASDAHCHYTDDAGVTHGCGQGSQGPGDRDDGGGMEAAIPDVAQDANDLPLYWPCWDNAQCASGICYDYKAKGQFCTKACTSDADCPAPSPGCNGMGFCRVGG
jgi:hypothetical protein